MRPVRRLKEFNRHFLESFVVGTLLLLLVSCIADARLLLRHPHTKLSYKHTIV